MAREAQQSLNREETEDFDGYASCVPAKQQEIEERGVSDLADRLRVEAGERDTGMRFENPQTRALVSLLMEAAMALERDAVTNDATEAEREHASHHPGRIPSPERVSEAHTQMRREDFNRPGGHRIYTQDGEEACYLCALLHEIGRLRATLAEVRCYVRSGDQSQITSNAILTAIASAIGQLPNEQN